MSYAKNFGSTEFLSFLLAPKMHEKVAKQWLLDLVLKRIVLKEYRLVYTDLKNLLESNKLNVKKGMLEKFA